MEKHIVVYCLIVFVSKLIFLVSRTWNVRAIAEGDMKKTMVSSFIVDVIWLVSISVGVDSMHKIITNFDMRYIPVIISSVAGGLLGVYLGMLGNKKG